MKSNNWKSFQLTEKEKALIKLLDAKGVEYWEITNEPYGTSLSYGPLKKLAIWDRAILDPEEFNKLGYGIVTRSSTFHPKPLPLKSSFALFLADTKARENS